MHGKDQLRSGQWQRVRVPQPEPGDRLAARLLRECAQAAEGDAHGVAGPHRESALEQIATGVGVVRGQDAGGSEEHGKVPLCAVARIPALLLSCAQEHEGILEAPGRRPL